MKLRPITPSFYVSSQIVSDEIAHAAATGFRLVICNRPDVEDDDQPAASIIESEAARNGLAFAHIPISSEPSDADIQRMKAALDAAGGPVLAYCRTGMRSVKLGALALSSHVESRRLVANAARVGYDLSAIASRLAHRYLGPKPDDRSETFDVVVVG